MTLRVWLITPGEPLPIAGDSTPRLMRTGTLARLMAERGHDVVWWTSAFDHFRKRHYRDEDSTIVWQGGTIRMLKSVGYRHNVSPRRFVEHAGVARKFRTEAPDRPKPDIILASLPTTELAREAVRFGKAQGIPVLVDVRDLWPDVLVDVLPPKLRWLSRMILTPMTRDAIYALTNSAGVIGVSEGYLSWGMRLANRRPTTNDAVFPLGYVAAASSEEALEAARTRLVSMGVDASKKLCWYVGSFGRQYDLAPVLAAASSLWQRGRRDVQFVISGDGDLGQHWRRLADGVDSVVFTGWVGADEINWLRNHAAIGLQPYAQDAPQGLANKLFEYLSAGVPVVSSLRGENQKLIEAHGCGLTYRSGDPGDCLQKIVALLDNEPLRRAMGQRGSDLFVRQFDSKVVFDGLAAHLEEIAGRHRRGTTEIAANARDGRPSGVETCEPQRI